MSTIKGGTIEKASGDPVNLTKQDGVKAWCSWNMDSTQTIKDSLNISSLTDTGSGNSTLTVVNAFISTNSKAPVCSAGFSSTNPSNKNLCGSVGSVTTCLFEGYSTANSLEDVPMCYTAILGDLA